MSYHHFSTSERARIEVLHAEGYATREIAQRINCHHSSIARELARNKDANGVYDADSANDRYRERRKRCVRETKCTTELASLITAKLLATWSPEQIVHTVAKGFVCFKSIYRWIEQGKLPGISQLNLRRKGMSKRTERRGKFALGTPISERPAKIDTREEFGHWELDTVVSSRGQSKGCLATFIERKTRLYTALMIPDRTADSMERAIRQLAGVLPAGAFLSGTTDRGKEFACYRAIEEDPDLAIDLYFADAYSSWQRGSNENANGLLRQFYPKKTDLALISQKELTYHLFLLNSRPRKCLGWLSPIEVFLEHLSHLT